MNTSRKTVVLPSDEQSIAPVTILDAQGRVVRVVPAEEFRRRRLAATTDVRDDRPALVSTRVRRALRRTPTREPRPSLARLRHPLP